MNSTVLTSTTNSIEGATIQKYFELVSVNVVVGTNVFSDFGASFTDFFGGQSGTYQSKLEKIYKIGLDKLKMKASYLGANAVLGIKIDFDEISGKGKSMFMLSVIGTAVKVEFQQNKKEKVEEISDSIVPHEILNREITRRSIIKKIEEGKLPEQDDWNFLMNDPIPGISEALLNSYLENYKRLESNLLPSEKLILENIQGYLQVIDEGEAVKLLFDHLEKDPVAIIKLMTSANLFSPVEIKNLLKNRKVKLAIFCLRANKNHYSREDLLSMEEILYSLENLEETGKTESVKNLLGKAKEKFICEDGHHNELSTEYCTNHGCGKNRKGLTAKEDFRIIEYKMKVDSLRAVLNN